MPPRSSSRSRDRGTAGRGCGCVVSPGCRGCSRLRTRSGRSIPRPGARSCAPRWSKMREAAPTSTAARMRFWRRPWPSGAGSASVHARAASTGGTRAHSRLTRWACANRSPNGGQYGCASERTPGCRRSQRGSSRRSPCFNSRRYFCSALHSSPPAGRSAVRVCHSARRGSARLCFRARSQAMSAGPARNRIARGRHR